VWSAAFPQPPNRPGIERFHVACSQTFSTSTPGTGQGWASGMRNMYVDTDRACATGDNRATSGTIRSCLTDPNEFEYIASGGRMCAWQNSSAVRAWNFNTWDHTTNGGISGPNITCPTAMMGLSQDRSQIIDKLDHMYPVPGGTHADIGLMWGLRALSPRPAWVDFFGHTGDMAPLGWNDNDVRKIMILLTDGENNAPRDFEGYYGCNENPRRTGFSNDRTPANINASFHAGNCWRAPTIGNLSRASLDNLTIDACEAVRETYNVELYTILVDVNDAGAVTLMRNCAGSAARAFNITSGELDDTFQAIAQRALRLTR
jgi:hypothetical protein